MDKKNWLRKKTRIKYKLRRISNDHKLVIFRSNKHIYGQILDVKKGLTIASSSSMDNDISKELEKNDAGKIGTSKLVAKKLSVKMKENKISKITFDRNGYRYHGRVKAFAEELRQNGINF